MAFGRKPQLTGPDFLLGVAQEAAERGQPYADKFVEMVWSAFSGDTLLVNEAIAGRPLNDYEASPVSIVATAVQMAQEGGDRQSVQEALTVGLSLLAKWPEYLAFTVGHPKLEVRADQI